MYGQWMVSVLPYYFLLPFHCLPLKDCQKSNYRRSLLSVLVLHREECYCFSTVVMHQVSYIVHLWHTVNNKQQHRYLPLLEQLLLELDCTRYTDSLKSSYAAFRICFNNPSPLCLLQQLCHRSQYRQKSICWARGEWNFWLCFQYFGQHALIGSAKKRRTQCTLYAR